MLENLDLDSLFDSESKYGKEYIMGELTDDMISRAEKILVTSFRNHIKDRKSNDI